MLVKNKCLRYLIPFTFSESFSQVCKRIDLHEEWKRDLDRSEESDLYAYIGNEFISEKPGVSLDDIKMGISWKSVSEEPECQLRFLNYNPRNDAAEKLQPIDFSIVDLGLVIFRNNLGFFWYEVETERELERDELIFFQNQFKEVGCARIHLFWERKADKPVPFLTGNWIADKLAFLKPSFLPERKNNYTELFTRTLDAEGMLVEAVPSEEELESYTVQPFVPDKALLFTYAAFESAEEEVLAGKAEHKISYCLTNGYNASYKCSDGMLEQIFQPFTNVLWFATKEGCSYLAWPDASNERFFYEFFPPKARNDYFTLYVKSLFQSYSLFLYAQKIQDSLSSVTTDYLSSEYSNLVTELFGEINLFLTKTMATSVSHIAHQNLFYVYMKERLYIAEDVASVTAGLDSLENLLREIQRKEELEKEKLLKKEERVREQEERERDQQMENAMYLFSMLTIFSAITDGFAIVELVKGFVTSGETWYKQPIVFAYGGILGFVGYLTCKVLISFIRLRRSSRKKNKQ